MGYKGIILSIYNDSRGFQCPILINSISTQNWWDTSEFNNDIIMETTHIFIILYSVAVCSSLNFVAMIKYLPKLICSRKRFILCCQEIIHCWGNSVHSSHSINYLANFFYITQSQLPRDGTMHSGLGPPTSISN